MTLEAIRKTIMDLISSFWTASPIEYDNQSIPDNLISSGWIRPTIIWGDSTIGELGDSGIGEGIAILWIDIFVPSNTGTKIVLEYWQILSDLFRRKSYQGVNFNEPSPMRGGKDSNSNMYKFVFKIPFEYFIN